MAVLHFPRRNVSWLLISIASITGKRIQGVSSKPPRRKLQFIRDKWDAFPATSIHSTNPALICPFPLLPLPRFTVPFVPFQRKQNNIKETSGRGRDQLQGERDARSQIWDRLRCGARPPAVGERLPGTVPFPLSLVPLLSSASRDCPVRRRRCRKTAGVRMAARTADEIRFPA